MDGRDVVAEMIAAITVEPDAGGWIGHIPDWFGPFVFGGHLIGQAVHAATRTAPQGRRIHSLHAYFLRPARSGGSVRWDVSPIRDGQSFATRQVEGCQDGKAVMTMTCSFTADTDGYQYELPLGRSAPDPDQCEPADSEGEGEAEAEGDGVSPWDEIWLGPTEPGPDGTMESTHRAWFRLPPPVPDDPHLHAALLAYLTDVTGRGGRPLDLESDITGMISLDHAAWFHRPPRVDDWLLYDVHSLLNTGGRGLLRGTFHDRDRRIVASVAQEMLLRPVA